MPGMAWLDAEVVSPLPFPPHFLSGEPQALLLAGDALWTEASLVGAFPF